MSHGTREDQLATPIQSDSETSRAPQAMLRMITGSWIAQAIFVAAKLGVADLIRDEPKSPDSLAEATGTHPRALYRVLRALASVGIFSEGSDGRFSLTPSAELLRSDWPGSLRPFAVMMGSEWVWRSWGEILHSVRTEEPAFDQIYGAPVFDYYAKTPEAARIGLEGLTSRSTSENAAVVAAYDFSWAKTIIDIGGGQGSLLATILARNPNSKGVLFEMPHVIELSSSTFEQAGVAERCSIVGGDFFASIPSGGDVYILKKVIHDWDDERARSILLTCRAAIPARGRLLLIELVVPTGNQPSFAKLLDLLMLVYPGGRERTEVEHGVLLASANFKLERVLPTSSSVSIVEAAPA
jgi:hypothetical protein